MLNFHAARLTFQLIIVTASVVFVSIYIQSANTAIPIESQVPTVARVPENPYDPAQYGVPDILGGYKVLAIFTLRDIPCMSPQAKRVLLQAHQSTVHEYLQQSQPLSEILTYLSQLPGEANTKWQLSIVGPGVTIEKLRTNTESLSASLKDKPCLQLGGPIDIGEFTAVPRK